MAIVAIKGRTAAAALPRQQQQQQLCTRTKRVDIQRPDIYPIPSTILSMEVFINRREEETEYGP